MAASEVSKATADKIVQGIKAGKTAPELAEQLDKAGAVCPWSTGWTPRTVRRVWRNETGKEVPASAKARGGRVALKDQAPAPTEKVQRNGNGNRKAATAAPAKRAAKPHPKAAQASGTSRGGTGSRKSTAGRKRATAGRK